MRFVNFFLLIFAFFPSFSQNQFPVDLALLKISSPLEVGCFGSEENLSVLVKNTGNETLDFAMNGLTVTVEINGTPLYTQTFSTGMLAVDATQDLLLSNAADFSEPGIGM